MNRMRSDIKETVENRRKRVTEDESEWAYDRYDSVWTRDITTKDVRLLISSLKLKDSNQPDDGMTPEEIEKENVQDSGYEKGTEKNYIGVTYSGKGKWTVRSTEGNKSTVDNALTGSSSELSMGAGPWSSPDDLLELVVYQLEKEWNGEYETLRKAFKPYIGKIFKSLGGM